jgi:hypothetical protein
MKMRAGAERRGRAPAHQVREEVPWYRNVTAFYTRTTWVWEEMVLSSVCVSAERKKVIIYTRGFIQPRKPVKVIFGTA